MDKDKAIPKWNQVRQDFTPYLLVCIGVFLLFSLFSFAEGEDGQVANWFGRIGYYVSFTLFYLLGKSAFFLAGFSLVLGVISFQSVGFDRLGKALFFPLFLIGASVSLNILETPLGRLGDGGGILGQFFSWMFGYLFGDTGRVIVVFFLFIYSGIIWLEDTSWGFTVGKLNHFSNFIYQRFGGKKDLSHLRLPDFLTDWVGLKKVSSSSEPFAEQSNLTKKWFERRTSLNELSDAQEEDDSKDLMPSFLKEEVSPILPREISEIPKYKYKNTSLYQGFFEETGNVFRFDRASISLHKKLKTEPISTSLYNAKVIDFRGMNFTPMENTPAEVKPSLAALFPNISETSSLKKSSPLVDFSDLEMNDNDIDSDGYEFEEEEILDEEEGEDIPEENEDEDEEVVEIEIAGHENFEIDTLDDEADDDLMASESLEEEKESLPVKQAESHLVAPSNVYDIEKGRIKLEKAAEKEEFPVGSMVPPVKLKKGQYYISHKLLADHKPTLAFHAKNDSELEMVGKKIEEIIGYYGIESKVIARERGPIITRYELTIPHGVKLSKITTLADELRLHLAVKNIRIVAPIPGKSSIGIEVPNIHREDVFLSEILKESLLHNKAKDLSISIGKDISGKIVTIDLAKLPHLLVAGTTGSGKSVSLNSMITSLICTRSPEEVRFIMIDPKMVEMTLYEDIPHLLMPVITDPKKATKALAWAINEMESRYQMVSKLKSRDFKSYNDKVDDFAHAKGYQKFPYIVIFIDELADLMMVSGKEIEEQITRISQKSRAVGIHLVMATQRPSVDVITGLIKANCPARAAFQVAQKTDSRTILDTNGAESLLGKGDFLYRSPVTSDLLRIQAPFIEEKEIEAIVEEAKKQGSPAYIEMNWDEEGSTESFSEEDEDLFEEAWNIVASEKKASASYLQRRMRIGYNKAARLMELMEARGYVSPQIGAKPREILRSA
jgi:S-DNA-T family DNA segregation ATPase FtsK/SpoIIIE